MKTYFKTEFKYQPVGSPEHFICMGIHKGVKFYIRSLGTHPCAYIRVQVGHPLYGLGSEALDELLTTHCGVTYTESSLPGLTEEGRYWYIGWDYGHFHDYSGSYIGMPQFSTPEYHRYTVDEILNDIEKCIDMYNSANRSAQ